MKLKICDHHAAATGARRTSHTTYCTLHVTFHKITIINTIFAKNNWFRSRYHSECCVRYWLMDLDIG